MMESSMNEETFDLEKISTQVEQLLSFDGQDRIFSETDSGHSTVIGANWQGFRTYAGSYKFAFETLRDKCHQELRPCMSLFLPMVYLFRHFVELQLKAILQLFDSTAFENNLHHRLDQIWALVRKNYEMKQQLTQEEIQRNENFGKLIKELSKIDQLSFNFRYPIKKNMVKSLDFSVIDFDNFVEVTNRIIFYLNCLYDLAEDQSDKS